MTKTDGTQNGPLRHWLDHLGWSPERLVHRVNAHPQTRRARIVLSAKAPYHWLNGSRPNEPVPGLVALVFAEASGERVTVASLGWDRPDAVTFPQADDGLTDLWAPGGTLGCLRYVLRSDTMPTRRTFVAISGMALTAAAHHWLIDEDRMAFAATGRRIDPSMVDDLDQIVRAKRRVDDAVGGGAILRSTREELTFVTDLLESCRYTEEVGRRLYGVAAELARLTGWAHYENGDDGQAQRYFLVALRSAHESGDRALGAHVQSYMAWQATRSGQTRDAIVLARSGLEGAGDVMTATEKAALHGRLAYAYGKAGDTDRLDMSAERAFELLARAIPGQDPDRVYWCTDADLAGVVGKGYAAARRPDEAIQYLRRALDGLPESWSRDRVTWLTALARAYLAAGRREEAVAEARNAAAVVVDLNSARSVVNLGQFREALARSGAGADSAEFDEYLRATFPRDQHASLRLV